MPGFGITTTAKVGKSSHSHGFFFDEERGGLTTVDHRHSHNIRVLLNEEALLNGMGEQVMDAQGQPSIRLVPSYIVDPDPEDGHTHELMPAPDSNLKDKRKEEEIVDHLLGLYDEATSLEKTSRDRGHESINFVNGKQWDEDVKSRLEREGRPAVTVNITRPRINLLCGYQQQNRTDIVYRPVEGGDQFTADIFTNLVKNIQERSDYHFEESSAFRDAAVPGRGILVVDENYDKNPEGDLYIRRVPWDSILYGPHDRADLSDCEVEIRTRWLTERQAKRMFPEYEDRVQKLFPSDPQGRNGGQPYRQQKGRQYEMAMKENKFVHRDLLDVLKKQVRLLEIYEKEYYRFHVAYEPGTNQFYRLDGKWSSRRIRSLETIGGVTVIPRTTYRIRKYVLLCDILVDDFYPDLPVEEFTSFPIYCYKEGDEFCGLVEDVKDAQRELNKKSSQIMDTMNRMSGSGYLYDDETFPSKTDEDRFRKNAGKPGFVGKVRDLNRPPLPLQPTSYPGGAERALEISQRQIYEIMNISAEPGVTNRDSGKAIQERRFQALVGNNHIFDNLAQVKKRLGRHLIHRIQALYTPERVIRILRSDPNATFGKEQATLDQFTDEQIITALTQGQVTDYDVVVDEAASNPTRRMANFESWANLRMHGVPVPDDLLVEMSDLPNKEIAIQRFQQQAQAAAAGEQGKQQAEIIKTLIAALSKQGMLPPEVISSLGGGQPQQALGPGQGM